MGSNKHPQLIQKTTAHINAEKCLICYGPHTRTRHDKGISYELKNLKDVFVKTLGIKFLPHFSSYGLIHMCLRCHDEFLKVERVFDSLDVEGNESSFDAVREHFAFIIVDSILKSQYINNYMHGNAFDAVRYLVFKEWSGKFKKQSPEKQPIVAKARSPPKLVQVIATSTPKPERNIQVQVVKPILSTPVESVKTVSTIARVGEKESIEKSLKEGHGSPPEEESKIEPQENEENLSNSALVEALENEKEESDAADKDNADAETLIMSRNSEESLSSDSEPELQNWKTDDIKDEPTTEEMQLPCNSVSPRTAKEEEDDNDIPMPTLKAAEKPLQGSSTLGNSNSVANAVGAGQSSEVKPDSASALDVTLPKSVSTGANTLKAFPQAQKSYILSPDGQKLIPRCGGEPFPKHKLIFVKRDPVTGKMVQVPKPNFNVVKGKLNGRDVLVRSGNFSKTVSTSGPVASASTIAAPKIGSVAPSNGAPAAKSPPSVTADDEPSSPSVPRIVSVQSMGTVKAKEKLPSPQKVSPTSSKESPETEAQSSKMPELAAEKNQATRCGRRIKRVYDSSSWASGQEMDELLDERIKSGRSSNSPNKRHKVDSRQSSVSSSQEQAPADFDVEERLSDAD